ncbi:tRNA (5-methylaminomethyl-2-thiouridine)(34)-methyltransferase MnmD [Cellulophaga tyrosinoxydans]|uniref:tRNA U34 5-methylaminomethyl-2-thiouridine-forming methyltransferase MnmC n=1 Tax=Cellulophaga tyrosinoxydans TaxID=504486 RepID=A0A1W2AL28_9FLAO|nr:tRNA (5-methylaminomethyl-2-thiouridine)(34)-methyltransferase MnmD [Cellulophaga tyrosinoxydans]SMC61386.1 tRNA U34 5-methylaminomethyl-2-thiouridine-forming methyltransferase MnmC [Cellulophaga tyrosinoxydans]
MERKIITTSDGSTTIQLVEWNEQYHSIHGAIQEAYHVFIKNGLSLFKNKEIQLLEIGYGTGLNAIITAIESDKYQLKINYCGVEAFPVAMEEIVQLNYIDQLNAPNFQDQFMKMHSSAWENEIAISDNFKLTKQKKEFQQINQSNFFDLIYFDAFGARVQPELWTEDIFQIMYKALKNNGVLVTYCAKGSVRRAMQAVGFFVERLPGPPGKREMLRATKKLS